MSEERVFLNNVFQFKSIATQSGKYRILEFNPYDRKDNTFDEKGKNVIAKKFIDYLTDMYESGAFDRKDVRDLSKHEYTGLSFFGQDPKEGLNKALQSSKISEDQHSEAVERLNKQGLKFKFNVELKYPKGSPQSSDAL